VPINPPDPKPNEPDVPGDNLPTVPPNQGKPLVNTISGGSGEAQRDMDPTRPGTQINVVIDDEMAKDDRKNMIKALGEWEKVSGGELEFLVHEEGEQPVGEDFTYAGTVPADNTSWAGAADVGRSPDGISEMVFEEDARLAVVIHELGHTLGFGHGDGVMAAVNATDEFSKQNLADLDRLYPGADTIV
jgi:hypothetical protein